MLLWAGVNFWFFVNVLNFTQVTKNLVTNLELSYLARMLQLVAVAMICQLPVIAFRSLAATWRWKTFAGKSSVRSTVWGVGWGRVEKKRGREREPEASSSTNHLSWQVLEYRSSFFLPQVPQGKHFLLKTTLTFRCAFTRPGCCLRLSTQIPNPGKSHFCLSGKLTFLESNEGISTFLSCWVGGGPSWRMMSFSEW